MSDETAEPRRVEPGAGSRPSAGLSPADKARLARIFGDVLPETTRDERGDGENEGGGADDWLRRQVPPHH